MRFEILPFIIVPPSLCSYLSIILHILIPTVVATSTSTKTSLTVLNFLLRFHNPSQDYNVKMPREQSYTYQEDILILFWKSRDMPLDLIPMIVYRHTGRNRNQNSIHSRLWKLRAYEEECNYPDLLERPGHYNITNVDTWIRRKQQGWSIPDADLNRWLNLFTYNLRIELEDVC